VKRWIFLVVLALLAGTALFLYTQYRDMASMKEFEGPGELTDRGIREGIRSEDPTLRLAAAEQIGKLPEDQRRAALLDALAADYAPTRLTALTVIGKGGPPGDEISAALFEMAREDPDPDVRDAAFRALGTSGDVRVLDLSLAILESLDAPLALKLRAARTLDRLTGRESAGALAGAVDEATLAADELSMEWDDWLGGNRERLRWDPEGKRFVAE
jgi:HEAT repeat protein